MKTWRTNQNNKKLTTTEMMHTLTQNLTNNTMTKAELLQTLKDLKQAIEVDGMIATLDEAIERVTLTDSDE